MRIVVLHHGRPVTVVLNSWLARLLKPGSLNNGVTLSPHTIRFARDWFTAKGLAHELGHTEQAARYGWTYLFRVAYDFLRYGYSYSPLELDADDYMNAHWREVAPYGPIPHWVATDA